MPRELRLHQVLHWFWTCRDQRSKTKVNKAMQTANQIKLAYQKVSKYSTLPTGRIFIAVCIAHLCPAQVCCWRLRHPPRAVCNASWRALPAELLSIASQESDSTVPSQHGCAVRAWLLTQSCQPQSFIYFPYWFARGWHLKKARVEPSSAEVWCCWRRLCRLCVPQ